MATKKRASSETKQAAVKTYLRGDKPRAEVAKHFGVSLATLSKWASDYVKEKETPMPMPRAPSAGEVDNRELRSENVRLRAKVRALLDALEKL